LVYSTITTPEVFFAEIAGYIKNGFSLLEGKQLAVISTNRQQRILIIILPAHRFCV
jgi:hypothetical protein